MPPPVFHLNSEQGPGCDTARTCCNPNSMAIPPAALSSPAPPDGIYLMNVDHRDRPRLALSILKSMKRAFKTVEIWHSNQTGKRATFTLAGLTTSTPYAELPARASPGVRFRRISPDRLAALTTRLDPIRLTDDYAPVDRLIGLR